MLFTGNSLDDGQLIRHKVCDNRICINPDHTAPGTEADNYQDMVDKGRAYVYGKPPKSLRLGELSGDSSEQPASSFQPAQS